jgi:trk system potassium uptake protein
MNYRLLCKVLGLLLLLLSVAMLCCLGVSFVELEFMVTEDLAPLSLSISTSITFFAGFALFWIGRKEQPEILRKEAIAIVGLGWILCAAFGALPYLFTAHSLGVAEAYFESMSGFTTTGSTVIRDLDVYPHSILLWRATTQWLGGMGILVLFVAVLSYLGVGSKSLFRHESSARQGEGFHGRIRTMATQLWQIYVGLSLICAAGLFLLGMSVFEAVTHAFTAISTGGFSSENASIGAYNSLGIELWLTLFMALGGVSFVLQASLLSGHWSRWKSEEETKLYLFLLAMTTVIIALDMVWRGTTESFGYAFRTSLFQVVSIMTTTGFVSADYDVWPPLSRVLLVVLMFIGGCAGSTAGGIKVSRLILFFKISREELIQVFRPNQVLTLRLNGIVASSAIRIQTLFFVALTGVVVAIGTVTVSILEPTANLITSFSSVVAVLFNIGPGLAAVGPTQNFADFTPATHVLMAILMALGRLELFAILVLFVPSLWKKY